MMKMSIDRGQFFRLYGSAWLASLRAATSELPCEEKDYVVLLHGLGRTSLSMKRIEWALKKEGYRVINKSYPSTRHSIEELADSYLAGLLREQIPNKAKVHFVAHSMGAIVLRQYLSNHRIERVGRVVMLAPPNQGSELADKLQRKCLYLLFTAPAGQQLGTDDSGLPGRLGAADYEVGIIAGDKSLNPFFLPVFLGRTMEKFRFTAPNLKG